MPNGLQATPLRWLCRVAARQMHAANGSYPNPRLAAWIRKRAGCISTPSLWPRERAYVGVCDFCEGADALVVAWGGEDAGSACEPCWTAMAEAWAALTPDEQAEAFRG